MGLIDPLQIALVALCALIVIDLVVLVVRDLTPRNLELNLLVVVEVGLLVQLVLGLLALRDHPGGLNVVVWVGYLVGALVILPAGVIWSAGEKTRAGTSVLIVAVLIIPFLLFRLQQIWSTHA